MASRFQLLVKKLQSTSHQLDENSQRKVLNCLFELAQVILPIDKSLQRYHDTLLFICAYPGSNQHLISAEKEVNRIALTLKKKKFKSLTKLENTGLPYTYFISNYSHDCLLWLNDLPYCNLELLGQSNYSLNILLALTLPSLERSYTTAGYTNHELLQALHVRDSRLFEFYLSQFQSLNNNPDIKDHFFEKLELEIKITPTHNLFSHAYNRVPVKSIFYHRDWTKKFDVNELLSQPLPNPIKDNQIEKMQIINCIKLTMTLYDRETDPTTYLESRSVRIYGLDRGLSIAIYGMIPSRQLPIESYVGFTLFKNGFPISYGGSWVFGRRANFGINIFEAFRGGESGYLMCQILRVYKQVFQLSFFEIEPYQFGLDNPDGLDSGAFWFYYRYGFRPLSKELKSLAQSEFKKIKNSKSYTTPKTVLLKFTESNLALNFDKSTPLSLPSVSNKITRMINQKYNGDRSQAVAECVRWFKLKSNTTRRLSQEASNAMKEVALMNRALNVNDRNSIAQLSSMVELKPVDLYGYAQALRGFLDNVKKI